MDEGRPRTGGSCTSGSTASRSGEAIPPADAHQDSTGGAVTLDHSEVDDNASTVAPGGGRSTRVFRHAGLRGSSTVPEITRQPLKRSHSLG